MHKIYNQLKYQKSLIAFILIFQTFLVKAQTSVVATTGFANNNGTGQVAFNFQNTNPYPVIIRGVESVASTAGVYTAQLWYKTTPISGAPGAIATTNGWNIALSNSITLTASGTSTVTQPFITGGNFVVPPFTTYGLVLTTATSVTVRYSTITAGTYTFSAGGCNIITGTNIGYGGTAIPPAAPANTPRGFIGNITFEPAFSSYNDAGVKALLSPSNFCGGTQDIKVRIANFGHNKIDSVRVNWKLDGVVQTPTYFSTPLDTVGNPFSNPTDTALTLGSTTFTGSTAKNLIVWTSYPNGIADTTTVNDTLTKLLKPSLSGTYTVGATGANYTSLTAIANDLTNYGICGPVNIIVNPGTYVGKASFNSISGVSAVNRISLTGTNKNTCILTDTVADAILASTNNNYFTIRNLTVINRFNGGCAGIALVGNSTNTNGSGSSVTNCIVSLPNAIASPSAAIFVSGSPISGANHNMDSITIDSNITTGGYYGVVVYGNTGASSANNKGFLVRNNTINNAYTYGLYMYYIYNPCKVLYNTISMNQANVSTGYGLYYYYCQNSNAGISTEIIGNKIINVQYMAMYIYYNASTATAPTKIYNNAIYGNMSYSTNYANYLYTGVAATYEYYHNTIHINGMGTTQYGLYYYNTLNANGITCKNNIFSIYSTNGTTVYPAYFSSNPTVNCINYNIYYNAKTTSLGFRGAAFTSANYNTTSTGGDSSFAKTPPFNSTTDLHLTDGCTRGVNLLSSVPNDYDGNPRGTNPSLGLYEFASNSNDLTVDILYNPSVPVSPGAQNLVARVKNAGSTMITGYNISYTLNGGTPITMVRTDTLFTCDTALVTFSGSNQLTIALGTNALKVYTSLPSGTTDGNLTNDTLRATFVYSPPLNGNYTIGGLTASFNTFADATFALQNSGINGPVYFTVNPGTYTTPVALLGPVYGTSATNTITFDGVNSSNRILSVNAPSTAFLINQVSYVTIKNLTVNNTYAGSCSGIALVGGTSSNVGVGFTVNKCIVNLPNTGTSTSYGIIVTGASSGMADGNQWADSVTIDSNIVTGGYYGIQISTSGNLNASYNRGHRIRFNTLNNIYYYGIRFYYISNAVDIISNNINMNPTNASSYGMYVYYNQNASANPTRIIKNYVYAGYAGIYYYYWTGGTSSNEISNNMFITYGASAYASAYVYTGATGTNLINIYHNSFRTLGATASYGLYYYNSTGTGTSYFKNNIFASNGTTTPAYFSTNPTGNVINYNVYYNPSSSTAPLIFRGSSFTSSNFLSNLAGGDTSYNVNPSFISNTNLRLTNACIRGIDLSSQIPTDIDGNSRSTTPVIGAHEATSYARDLSINNISYALPTSPGLQDLRVVIRNNAVSSVTSMNVRYKLNGGTTVTLAWTGTLNGCDTTSVLFTGTNQINIPAGFNTLKVYTDGPNGLTDNYTLNDTLTIPLNTVTKNAGNAFFAAGVSSAKYYKLTNQANLNATTAFSMEAWVKPTINNTDQKILAKSSTTNGFCMGINPTGGLDAEIWTVANGTGSIRLNGAGLVPTNTWTHVAVTWQSGVGVKTYINGMQTGAIPSTVTTTMTVSGNDQFVGMNSWDMGFAFNGAIDEVRTWSIAIDSAMIRKNMHRALTGKEAGLMSYTQLNESTSATQFSDQISGATGIIVGAPLIPSTLPLGNDTALINFGVNSTGYYLNGDMIVLITDPFDNACDLTMTEIPYPSNVLPAAAHNLANPKFWVLRPFGTPGTYTADITIGNLQTGSILTTDTAVRLYTRAFGSDAAWTIANTATTSNITSNTVTFTNISTFGQFTIASNGTSTLPVKLLSFGGKKVDNAVELNWATAAEYNNAKFEIERAYNTIDGFEKIGEVKSIGNSSTNVKYNFTDNNAEFNNTIFYRLKQVDFDGKYSYSPIVNIDPIVNGNIYSVYPNPFTNKLIIESNVNENTDVKIYDIHGKLIHAQTLNKLGKNEITTASEMKQGVYFIKINGQQTIKLIKQ